MGQQYQGSIEGLCTRKCIQIEPLVAVSCQPNKVAEYFHESQQYRALAKLVRLHRRTHSADAIDNGLAATKRSLCKKDVVRELNEVDPLFL